MNIIQRLTRRISMYAVHIAMVRYGKPVPLKYRGCTLSLAHVRRNGTYLGEVTLGTSKFAYIGKTIDGCYYGLCDVIDQHIEHMEHQDAFEKECSQYASPDAMAQAQAVRIH